ncbi:MAG: acyltransferase family protein, partial [Acidimicrobiales bacterium]
HLYFLLVSMQIYLLFPLIARFVRATADKAVRVLVVVGVVNVIWLAAVGYLPGPGGAATWLWDRAYELAPTYTLCILAGAYAAVHLGAIEDLLRRRERLMWQVAAGSAAFALLAFAVQLLFMAPRTANAVLQPAMLATCLSAAIALYLLGLRWTERGRPHENLVKVGTDVSFGVYLAHPLVLMLLLGLGLDNIGQRLPAPISTVLAFAGTVAGSVGLVLVLRRTPLSFALTGRPRMPITRQSPAPERAAPDRAVRRPVPALQPALPALPAAAPSLTGTQTAPLAILQRNLPDPI